MPRWFMPLKGHEFDLLELSELFCPGVRGVIQQEGKYYLVSSEFDALEDAAEVRQRGKALLSSMSVASQLGNSSYQPVECDDMNSNPVVNKSRCPLLFTRDLSGFTRQPSLKLSL